MKEAPIVEAIKSIPQFNAYFFIDKRWNEKQIYEYAAMLIKAFPGLDIPSQVFRMGLWLTDDENGRRHKKNYRGFIHRWLSRTSDRQPAAAAAIDRRAEWRKDINHDMQKKAAREKGQLLFDDTGITDADIKQQAQAFRERVRSIADSKDMKKKIGLSENKY